MLSTTRVIPIVICILIHGMTSLHGAELVLFDFTGQPGNQLTTPYQSVDSNLTAGNLTRGAGITAATYSNSMCSTGWSTSSILDTSQNDYYEFTIQPDTNYKYIVGHLMYGYVCTTYGPTKYAWRTSLNSYSQNWFSGSNNTGLWNKNIFGTPILECTSSVTFRMYNYYASSSSYSFGLMNNSTAGGLVLTGVVLPVSASYGMWSGSGGGSYNLNSNWNNSSIPNGNDAAALFWPTTSSDSTVTVDSPITLGTIDLDGWFYNFTLAGSATIQMRTSVGNPRIGVVNGSNLISAPLNLAGNTDIDCGSSTLSISGNISGTSGITKSGAGSLLLSGTNNTYSGNTVVTAGTLIFSGGIGAGGTSLIDVQSGNASLKTVNVNKSNLNINTAALATFEIVNGAHTVGIISGNGTTLVDSTASLTAAAISQGTLTIGSGATVTIQALPGGPQGGAINPVPEPSTLSLFAGAFILFMLVRAKTFRR